MRFKESFGKNRGLAGTARQAPTQPATPQPTAPGKPPKADQPAPTQPQSQIGAPRPQQQARQQRQMQQANQDQSQIEPDQKTMDMLRDQNPDATEDQIRAGAMAAMAALKDGTPKMEALLIAMRRVDESMEQARIREWRILGRNPRKR